MLHSNFLRKVFRLLIVSNLNTKLSRTTIQFSLVVIFVAMFFGNALFAQTTCNIACDELVGGINSFASWGKVNFYTKKTDAANYDVDQLSTYTLGGTSFVNDNIYFGVGVEGPANDPNRYKEINYFSEVGRSEKLLVDFGNCGTFTGAIVTLNRFYGLEGNQKGEAGCWKAFDANFVQVGGGTFFADQPIGNNNTGTFTFDLRTNAPYKYLEFTATPYINSLLKTNFVDDSDYLLKGIKPTCIEVLTCDDVIGGTNEFESWAQLAITTRAFNSQVFNFGNANNFVGDSQEITGSNGLGVPDDEDVEINYDSTTNQSEALRITMGKSVSYAQFTASRLFEGEVGYWIAYKAAGCALTEVGRGEFLGEEGGESVLKSGGTSGQKTVTVTTSGDFDVVEFTSGPIQSTKSTENTKGSGYVLHQFVACPECNGGAFRLISYEPKLNKDGTAIESAFTQPNNAIGTPQDIDAIEPVNFVSLGFGGSITLRFALPFANGVGPDLSIFETSEATCEAEPEKADVFASQNGIDYVYLGRVCQNGTVDLGILTWASHIKIIDASDKNQFYNAKANGFDLDGIKCLNGVVLEPEPDDVTTCSAQFVKKYVPGTKKNGGAIVSPRNNPLNALGEADALDQHNKFVSLGFGDGRQKGVNATKGYIELGFNAVIFDKQNAKEIIVYETSFGNPRFREYPEQAEVYASKDGTTWVSLGKTNAANPNTQCNLTLDTEFDFTGKIEWARFIKIVDITDPNARKRRSNDCAILQNQHPFNNAGDGFDVDAVTCTQATRGTKNISNNKGAETPSAQGFEIEDMNLYPNPATDVIYLDFSQSPELVLPDENLIKVNFYTPQGKLIQQSVVEIDGDFMAEINISNLPKGLNIVRINANQAQKILKLVKVE